MALEKQDVFIEKYYLNEAKKLTNLMYNNNFLNSALSRQSIDWLEDFVGFFLQSNANSIKKMADFSHRFEKKSDAKDY